MSELFNIWPHLLLACGLNLPFHYGWSHWQTKDELLQAKSRRSEAVQSRGEVLVMLKAHREEGHKRQRRLCRNEGLVTVTDPSLIFSHALSSFLLHSLPSLTLLSV